MQRTPRLVGRGIVGDSFTQRTRLTVHVDSEAAKLSLVRGASSAMSGHASPGCVA